MNYDSNLILELYEFLPKKFLEKHVAMCVARWRAIAVQNQGTWQSMSHLHRR